VRLFPAKRVQVNVRVLRGFAILFVSVAPLCAQDENPFRVEIDLQQQTAFLIRGRRMVMESPISSGRYGHLTETGSFKVIEKELNHHSSIYGKIVDASGRTIVADADVDMKVPRGGRFIPAPMRYFMRFHSADGMHAGYLPGYPASHGCVRMPEQRAIAFFNQVEIGTPVHVFGRTPRTRDFYQYGPQPLARNPWLGPGRSFDPRFDPRNNPRFDPRYAPRYVDPWWR
jgi:L,D-transpeptidase catalytic domain